MKQRSGKASILIPIGLFLLSGTMLITQFTPMPDIARGLLFGIAIGLMILSYHIKRVKPNNF